MLKKFGDDLFILFRLYSTYEQGNITPKRHDQLAQAGDDCLLWIIKKLTAPTPENTPEKRKNPEIS